MGKETKKSKSENNASKKGSQSQDSGEAVSSDHVWRRAASAAKAMNIEAKKEGDVLKLDTPEIMETSPSANTSPTSKAEVKSEGEQ